MKQTTHTDKAGIKKESLWTTLTCGLRARLPCAASVRGFRARLPGVVTGHGHGPWSRALITKRGLELAGLGLRAWAPARELPVG